MIKILVIACRPDDHDTPQLKAYSENFHFYFEEVTDDPNNIDRSVKYIIGKYREQDLDGVIGTHDNPGSYVAAVIAKELGLHGPDLTVIFVCMHKYYSREAQKKIVPSAVPEFQYLPIDNLKREDIALPYPFFVKPVKSSFSILARPIDSFEALEAFLPKVREQLAQSVPAFNFLLKKYTALELDANCLIAEQMLDGAQVTVEGFSWNGEVSIMGITDSVMYPGTMSFERFEYPSRLPATVRRRMSHIAEEVIQGMGLDNSVFNIEMFYAAETGAIHIIEINPRMSHQFADLFEKVDGTNTYTLQLQLSQGKRPRFENGKGCYGVAASYTLRLFKDGVVERAPTQTELAEIRSRFPDTGIVVKAEEGVRLSDLSQDETSYRYAVVNLAGRDWGDLYARFGEIKQQLRFEFRQ